jgi:uncharacterized RDD family membrane protein YckC
MNEPAIPLEWVPTLVRRYATTVIDGLLVFLAVAASIALWGADGAVVRPARVASAVAAILLYEPLCTGRFVTLGQWIMAVRVRRFDSGERLGVARAFLRIITKVVLGIFSFLVLPFTPGRRALHDMATGSIVIMADAEMEFSRWASSRAAATAP